MNKFLLAVIAVLASALFLGADFNDLSSAAFPYRFLGGTAANCQALTNGSQQYTFSTSYNVFYEVCSHGNEAYVLHGANPTATTTVTTGYDSRIPEGACTKIYKPPSAKIAFIATSTAVGAAVCFKPYTIP